MQTIGGGASSTSASSGMSGASQVFDRVAIEKFCKEKFLGSRGFSFGQFYGAMGYFLALVAMASRSFS